MTKLYCNETFVVVSLGKTIIVSGWCPGCGNPVKPQMVEIITETHPLKDVANRLVGV
jgi:hypothetical protein